MRAALEWASGGMADARGLGPRGETLAGSSPVSPTNTAGGRKGPGERRCVYETKSPGSVEADIVAAAPAPKRTPGTGRK